MAVDLNVNERSDMPSSLVSIDNKESCVTDMAQQSPTISESTFDSRSPLATSSSKNATRTGSGILSGAGRLIRIGRGWLFRNRIAAAGVQQARPQPPPKSIIRRLNEYEDFDGYPKLAVFQDSEPSFMVYRRFGFLSTRVLLDKQDELRVLEEQLNDHDRQNMADAGTTDPQGEHTAARKAILDDIQASFTSYSSMLLSAQQLMAFNRPSDAEHRSVSNFLHYKRPIHAKQRVYINYKEDLVTLRSGREHAWLDQCLEYLLKKLHKPFPVLNRLFCTKDTLEKNVDPDIIYTSPERVNLCASVIIMAVILALLVVPIYILYHLVVSTEGVFSGRTTALCMGVLLISTLAFSAVLTFFTRARRHEILAAAAAYCAVLVVFFGNVRS